MSRVLKFTPLEKLRAHERRAKKLMRRDDHLLVMTKLKAIKKVISHKDYRGLIKRYKIKKVAREAVDEIIRNKAAQEEGGISNKLNPFSPLIWTHKRLRPYRVGNENIKEVQEAIDFAVNSPYPEPEEALKGVFAGGE